MIMYRVFFGEVMFPVAPPFIEMVISGRNRTLSLVSGGEINILKHPELTTLRMELLLPSQVYPFAQYPDGFREAAYYLAELEKRILERKDFLLVITRDLPSGEILFHTSMPVSLEGYTILEDAEKYGLDIGVAVDLKQYRDFGTGKMKMEKQKDGSILAREIRSRPSRRKQPRQYTVQEGDTLFTICKKQLGDGERYLEIAKKNGIQSPNVLLKGQKIRF